MAIQNKMTGLSMSSAQILYVALVNHLQNLDRSLEYVDPEAMDQIEYLIGETESIIEYHKLNGEN